MDMSIASRIDRIERRLRFYRYAFLASFIVLAFVVSSNVFGSPDAAEILRVKGLIIEDSQDRPRIIMGAPAPEVVGRKRKDELVGIAYLDENGFDRLTFGQEPDPMSVGGIKPRRIGGVGVLIHDKEGIERGGYGVLDDGTAVLTLDWPKTGEAVALSSNEQFSAIGLFHRSEPGVYRDALTLVVKPEDNQSFFKITDTSNTQRVKVQTTGTENTLVKLFDENGKEVSSQSLVEHWGGL